MTKEAAYFEFPWISKQDPLVLLNTFSLLSTFCHLWFHLHAMISYGCFLVHIYSQSILLQYTRNLAYERKWPEIYSMASFVYWDLFLIGWNTIVQFYLHKLPEVVLQTNKKGNFWIKWRKSKGECICAVDHDKSHEVFLNWHMGSWWL